MNKRNLFFTLLVVAISLLSFNESKANVRLPAIFSNNMVLQRNGNIPVWGWASVNKTVTVKTSWNNKVYVTKSDDKGRWKLKVSTPDAGGPFTMSIADGQVLTLSNILIGDVWLCGGQSNMEMPVKGFTAQPVLNSTEEILNSTNNYIRLIKITNTATTTPQDSVKAIGWFAAAPESVANFSATGWFFGKLIQQQLHIPIGLISCNWGGSNVEAWMDAQTLKDFSDIKIPQPADSIKRPNQTPTALYNGMLHVILGYGIKGVIWYQGESNRMGADEYAQLLPAMVKQWRNEWGMGEFPFYYSQIAPYNYGKPSKEKDNSAYLRDVQRKCLDVIPNSGMSVLMDIGEEYSIHPSNKKAGGERLALLALHQTYGMKGFGYASPLYEKLSVKDSTATIYFKNADNGLTTFGQPLTSFEIAGNDSVFHPAKAIIRGGTIVVSSPEVKQPVAVRYAFKDFIKGELFNTEGLPASSFKTDEW
jgi:sialate O-acetylesterase